MKLGTMAARLPDALAGADLVFCFGAKSGKHALGWDPAEVLAPLARASHRDDIDALVDAVVQAARPGDHVLVEQRRLRRHPRQAAGCAGATRLRRARTTR